MDEYTVISDPVTGLLYESRRLWNDAGEAFRTRSSEFRLLQDDTRAISTHDGCTVGENAAWLTPGEYLESDGLIVSIGELS